MESEAKAFLYNQVEGCFVKDNSNEKMVLMYGSGSWNRHGMWIEILKSNYFCVLYTVEVCSSTPG